MKLGNIVTYGEEVLDTFDRRGFGPVDSLILSWASYLKLSAPEPKVQAWQGVRFGDLFRAEHFKALFPATWDTPESRQLFTAMAASPRFRDIRVKGYTEQTDPEREKQFAAVSFQLNKDLCYVAFRGTDSTLVGWKEDFNMAFQYPVPAQKAAAEYLAEAAKHCTGSLRVGGHSKGGNLAVYAAAKAGGALQKRIVQVYSHDGPGFLESVLKSGEWSAIAPKIHKTLPQSSLVGMLLEQQENFRVVRSDKFSIWQHDPFSWQVEDGDLCYVDALTPGAQYLDRTLNRWVSGLSVLERERFVDSLYALVDTAKITSLAQLFSDWQESIPALLRAASQLDEDTREFLFQTVKALIALGVKNYPEMRSLREGQEESNGVQ